MTIANDVINLALKTSGVVGVGQTPQTTDVNDAFVVLIDMVKMWQEERAVAGIPGFFDGFPNLTTDIPSWTPHENALLWGLSVRLRPLFGLPEDEQQTKLAQAGHAVLQANNKQQQSWLHAGNPATPIQIIFLALRAIGRITDMQNVADGSADVDNAFSALTMMMAQWSKQRWLVYDEVDVWTVSNGSQGYTIGPNGDFNLAARPDQIESAFVRMPARVLVTGGEFSSLDFSAELNLDGTIASASPPGAIDYPLDIIAAREDYNRISIKGLKSFPSCVFLDSGYPLGTVYVWPVPVTTQFEIHLSVKATLPTYAGVNAPLGLPPEYNDALVYNLAVRLAVLFGGSPSQDLMGLARATLQTLRKANLQIPMLTMPSGLPGTGGRFGGYGGGFFGGIASGLTSAAPAPTTINGVALLGADGARLLGADGSVLLAPLGV